MNEFEKIYELLDSLHRRLKNLEKAAAITLKGISTDKFCTEDAEKVAKAVCQAAGMDLQEFWDSIECRKNEYAKLRYHCYLILRQMKYTFGCIGATFAGKNHASVMNGIEKIYPLTQMDPFHRFVHNEAMAILKINELNQ